MSWTIATFAIAAVSRAPAPRAEVEFGVPTRDYVVRAGYIAGRSGHFTPWVLRRLTSANFIKRASRETRHFHIGDDQPAEFRWSPRDYLHSGFDIGHIGDANAMTFSAAAMDDSFDIRNTMPQTPELNRGPWRMLEEHVARLSSASRVAVFELSGPAWLPNEEGKILFETLGPGGRLWISTHCWKAILIKRPAGRLEMHGWILPNTAAPPKFEECAASIDEIEAASGFDLFSRLDDAIEEKLEAAR